MSTKETEQEELKAAVTIAYECPNCIEFEVTHSGARLNLKCSYCGADAKALRIVNVAVRARPNPQADWGKWKSIPVTRT